MKYEPPRGGRGHACHTCGRTDTGPLYTRESDITGINYTRLAEFICEVCKKKGEQK